ncbi:1-phosphofructokinase [Actinomadura sp. NAK00032]|uniref:1-phosphofructokinase n=1 Tax=Actinomadura sp. NAK00032 TaxID=2742128 RepID=UPI00159276BA|nr:1-phosphofructokinase [Actinomadura sp. NAK00032]QKW35995.1 1-phosphofructokinase [Actinomadura sp. NAK00032]
MIVTVTLNPSLDRTIEVDVLTRGAVIRARSARLDPGGKGVNVSRALLANGVPSTAVVAVGGADGDQLHRLLAAEGMRVRAVRVAGRTRSNVTIAEPGGLDTKLNEPGGPLSHGELAELAAVVAAEAGAASWVVGCGSLPPGVPDDTYAALCRRFAPDGVRVAVDSSGAALRAAVAAGPDLIKPNREELAEAVGGAVDTVADVVEAAGELRARGARTVLVSLGAEGAVLVDDDGVRTGEAPVARPRGTVGAGDALLAGFLAAGARGPAALAEALAWGAAAVRTPTGRMPGPAEIHRDTVRIHSRPDLARPLLT